MSEGVSHKGKYKHYFITTWTCSQFPTPSPSSPVQNRSKAESDARVYCHRGGTLTSFFIPISSAFLYNRKEAGKIPNWMFSLYHSNPSGEYLSLHQIHHLWPIRLFVPSPGIDRKVGFFPSALLFYLISITLIGTLTFPLRRRHHLL